MAAIASTTVEHSGQLWRTQWSAVTETDTFVPVPVRGRGECTLAVDGNFGAGGTVVAEGTLDREAQVTAGTAVWYPLSDPQGNAFSKTAAGLETIMEICTFIRLRVSAGTGVNVRGTLLTRKAG